MQGMLDKSSLCGNSFSSVVLYLQALYQPFSSHNKQMRQLQAWWGLLSQVVPRQVTPLLGTKHNFSAAYIITALQLVVMCIV